jgi:hypothetical protein
MQAALAGNLKNTVIAGNVCQCAALPVGRRVTETRMKFGMCATALAAAAVALTGAAAAATMHYGKRHAAPHRCVDRPYQSSWDFLWSTGNEPRANGCAPAVYQSGRYIGQDPDANVRLQLMRDPAEGDLSFSR